VKLGACAWSLACIVTSAHIATPNAAGLGFAHIAKSDVARAGWGSHRRLLQWSSCFWALGWLLERKLCGSEVVHFPALVAAGWNFGADLVPELRKCLSGRVFLGASDV
jgi:hypothetical protein